MILLIEHSERDETYYISTRNHHVPCTPKENSYEGGRQRKNASNIYHAEAADRGLVR
jgi:hypothetical protein